MTDAAAPAAPPVPPGPPAPPARLSPLSAMRRVWPVTVVLVVLGLLAGVAYGKSRPTVYTAAARLTVGSGPAFPQNIGAFEIAAEQVAANYARSVDTNTWKPQLPASVGNVTGVQSITATQVPDSAVIEIDVDAADEATAVAAAAYVQKNFLAQTNAIVQRSTPESIAAQLTPLQTQLTQISTQIQLAQTDLQKQDGKTSASQQAIDADRALITQLSPQQANLQTQVTALTLKYQAAVSSTDPSNSLVLGTVAALKSTNTTSLIERYGLLGLAAGAVLALLAAVGLDVRRVRRETAALEAARPLAAVTDLRPDAPEPAAAATPAPRAPADAEPAAPAAPAARKRRGRGRHEQVPGPRHAADDAPAARPEPAPEAEAPAVAAKEVDPYLAQALRSSLDQQRQDEQARRDADAEAHRREVRDALQRASRAAAEHEPAAPPSSDPRDFFAHLGEPAPEAALAEPAVAEPAVAESSAAADEPAPAPEPAVVEPEPVAEEPYDGPMAEVRPLFRERGAKARRQIRVLPATEDPERAGGQDEPQPWSPLLDRTADLDDLDDRDAPGRRGGRDDRRGSAS